MRPVSRLGSLSALAVLLALLFGSAAAAAAPAQSSRVVARPEGIEIGNGAITLRVTALTDSILRIRVARGGRFAEDASWAVPAEVRRRHIAVRPSRDGFSTAALVVHVEPRTLRLTVTDRQGRPISSDVGDAARFDGSGFTLRKAMRAAEHVFGLGDKTGLLDRRGGTLVDWDTDSFGYAPSTDPIYKSIPFFVAVGGPGGAYGLFLDNSWRTSFDFGHRTDGVIEIGAAGGPVDYYLIAGPALADVVRHYADLTGKAPLAPLWALGYQQSRWSYMSDGEVRQLAARFRQERFPLNVIWLDIDYQDRNRPFTVNKATFPDMRRLNADMAQLGIRLVAITDLHVAYLPGQNYAPYDSGAAGNHFVLSADGRTYVAPVWPGPSVFPDFTRAATRAWWGGLYKDFVADGFAGFWNDMNEPAVFDTPSKTMPLDNIHRIESDDFAPRDATHAEIHNVYGMENSRATLEGMQRLRPNVRPFVMTRASYAGGQRYAATWTGDNSSTWDHLRLAVQQQINLGLSGFAYSGADVGGFTGGASPELMTRWFEFATFMPIFRDHSMKGAPRAEPWVDGPEQLAIRRRYVEERYRLMPYLYALAEQNARTGDPIMRPVFYDYPDALGASCDQAMTFTLGRDLLIAGPPKPESPAPFGICLPKGGWYDYWTGLPVPAGETLTRKPKLAELPVFVRAGTILPRQPLVQSTAETPHGPLSLDIYPGEDCRGTLYLDDGVTVNGPSLRQAIGCREGPAGLVLHFNRRVGSYPPWWNRIEIAVHGWDKDAVVAGGSAIRRDAAARTLHVSIPDQPGPADILIAPR
ncbi:MAG TPA: TIM-barrel domain-containing protein [Allosphingosinicella sp.]|jgi:alpha-glucosidase|nr:TIM-barrel domain-containing protein [Allosphingosinicella sp.]